MVIECKPRPEPSPTLATVRAESHGGGDAVLLARLAAGDERALGIVYDQHADMVYGLARRAPPHPPRARETPQGVFPSRGSHPQGVALARASLRASLGVAPPPRPVDEGPGVTRRTTAESKAHDGEA